MIWCIDDNIHIDRSEIQIAIIIVVRLVGDDDLDDDDPVNSLMIIDTYIKDMIWCIDDNIRIDCSERQIAIIIVVQLASDDDLGIGNGWLSLSPKLDCFNWV
jgi:hypothetical protein